MQKWLWRQVVLKDEAVLKCSNWDLHRHAYIHTGPDSAHQTQVATIQTTSSALDTDYSGETGMFVEHDSSHSKVED